jgi:hypothetical protein
MCGNIEVRILVLCVGSNSSHIQYSLHSEGDTENMEALCWYCDLVCGDLKNNASTSSYPLTCSRSQH